MRSYITFSLGAAVSFVGTWAQKLAMGWLVWELTHSVAWVGTVALVEVFAALVVTPFAGAVGDRVDPIRFLIWVESALMVLALGLSLGSFLDLIDIYVLFVLALLDASLRGIVQPLQMLLPGILARPEQISRAIALSAVSMTLAGSIGPAVAGGILSSGKGVGWVFLFNAVTYLMLLTVLFWVKRRVVHVATRQAQNLIAGIIEGVRYVANSSRLMLVFVMAFGFSFLARPFAELLPAIVGHYFAGQAGFLAALMTAQGVGAFLGSCVMLVASRQSKMFLVLLLSSLGVAASMVAFFSLDATVLLIIAVSVFGFFHVSCNIAVQSLCQLHCEPAFKGRVMALYGMCFRAGPAIGAFCISRSGGNSLAALLAGAAVLYGALAVVVFLRSAQSGLRPPKHKSTEQ